MNAEWMDGWMDRIDRWMDRQVEGKIDGWIRDVR